MSYGGNADPTGIQVTFLDQTGAKSVKAVIAFSVPVSRILPNIITKMNLPTTSPDGQPMSYSLDHKEGGRRLIESQTLVEAAVQNGDHLIVYPELGAGYPRTMPELRWLTPIYHPNISEIGMVCLGGYGTHWVPSLNLDELCGMLWDMARYHNYDIRSPYNREAALWVANQSAFLFPLDTRPLRDLRAALGRLEADSPASWLPAPSPETAPEPRRSSPEPGSKAGKYADFVRR